MHCVLQFYDDINSDSLVEGSSTGICSYSTLYLCGAEEEGGFLMQIQTESELPPLNTLSIDRAFERDEIR